MAALTIRKTPATWYRDWRNHYWPVGAVGEVDNSGLHYRVARHTGMKGVVVRPFLTRADGSEERHNVEYKALVKMPDELNFHVELRLVGPTQVLRLMRTDGVEDSRPLRGFL